MDKFKQVVSQASLLDPLHAFADLLLLVDLFLRITSLLLLFGNHFVIAQQ